MKRKKRIRLTLLFAGMVAAAGLCGCSSDRDPNAEVRESSAADSTEPVQTEQTEAQTEQQTEKQTEATESTAETTSSSAQESRAETPPAAISGADDDTKLLWSERGLEAVPIDSKDGYGEELAAGSDYLNWTLNGFDGKPSGDAVPEVQADFTYNGQLQQNGQIRVLSGSDPYYPNGLYMHVDNLADFPYFPKDTRDRGWFVIENADEVLEFLGLKSSADISGDLSVTVSVDQLHVHVSADHYDTLHVLSASKR